MLSVFYDDKIEYQLKEVGVKGYLSKDVESDFLIQQIRLVLDGHIAFFCPKRELYFNGLSGSGNFFLPPHNLSLRELEIVSLIRRGLTSNEIAEKLFISINTVEAHRKHIFKKLHLKNIQGIVEFAFKYSL